MSTRDLVTLALEAGWRELKLVEEKCEATALEIMLSLSKIALPDNNLSTTILQHYSTVQYSTHAVQYSAQCSVPVQCSGPVQCSVQYGTQCVHTILCY